MNDSQTNEQDLVGVFGDDGELFRVIRVASLRNFRITFDPPPPPGGYTIKSLGHETYRTSHRVLLTDADYLPRQR